MKKYLYLASAAALALASCSDDLGLKPTTSEVEGGVTATFVFGDGNDEGTRTSLGYGAGNYYYQWSPNDQIGIFNATKDAATPQILNPDITNAVFTYASGTQVAQFNGDQSMLLGGEYVAYYPWERGIQLSKPEGYGEDNKTTSAVLPMTIPVQQNFNYNAADVAWSTNYATGCFSENVAPAIAWGQATVSGDIQLQFYPTASFLVVPIQGITDKNIKMAKLELIDVATNTAQWLTGTFNVDVLQFQNNPKSYMELEDASKNDSSDVSYLNGSTQYVTVYFGANGLELNPAEPVNLWFVVPTWAKLANQKLVVSFYDGTDVVNGTPVATVDRTLDGKNFSDKNHGMVGYNQVRWIFAESGTPFSVTDVTNYYVISTPQQFLEYAYLASTTTTTITQVYNSTWKALRYKGYSDLQNMVVFNEDKSVVTDLKDAYIAGNIKFSAANIENWIKNSEGFGSNKSLNGLEEYYKNVYGYYAYGDLTHPKGYIPSIGGNQYLKPLVIKGVTSDAGLDGLNIYTLKAGDGFFSNQNKEAQIKVSNLTISNANVSATVKEVPAVNNHVANNPGYGFLANVYGEKMIYQNVTVGSGCSFTPVSWSSTNVALFNEITSTDYMNAALANPVGTKYIVAANNSLDKLPQYANELDIYHAKYQDYPHYTRNHAAMDFSLQAQFAAVSNFRKVYLVPNQSANNNTTYGYGSLLRIPGASGDNVPNVVALMNKITNNLGNPVLNNRLTYSIVDTNKISYWTGTNSYYSTTDDPTTEAADSYTQDVVNAYYTLLADGTAEQLASVVQVNGVTSSFDSNNSNNVPFSLNLMGTYSGSKHMTWWNNGRGKGNNTMVIGNPISSSVLQISNVYMTGARTAGTGNGLATVLSESIGTPSNPGSGTPETGNSTPELKQNSVFMTLFGNEVNVNKVNVTDFTVVPAENTTGNNIIIATFGFQPMNRTISGTTYGNSNLTVGNMTVANQTWNTLYGADEYNKSGHIGGLFMVQTTNNISNSTISMKANSYNGWVLVGKVAGHLDFQITGNNSTLSNAIPSVTDDIFQAYGDLYFTVNGKDQASSTLNVNGFGVPFNQDNIYMYFQPGASGGDGANQTYALFLNQNGTNRTSWLYQKTTNSWKYNGTFAD